MSMRDEQRRLMDEAIDDTARAMTAGAPGATLRERIAQRIGGPRPSAWRTAWPIGAAAVATLLAALLLWPSPPHPGTPASTTAAENDPVAARPTSPPVVENQSVARTVPRSRGGPHPADASTNADAPPVIESLVIEPIETDRLAFDALPEPTPLIVERLNIAPLPIR